MKRLCRRVKTGEVPEFTGISSPYEPPENPELILNTGEEMLEVCVPKVMELLRSRGITGTACNLIFFGT